MGNDTPLAVLSDRPQLLYNYFKQLFAQVTNPPIDGIREELITATEVIIGSEGNLLEPRAESCRQIKLKNPILTNEELEKIRNLKRLYFRTATLPILFNPAEDGAGLEQALEALYAEADRLIANDEANIIILSDRGHRPRSRAHPGLAGGFGPQLSPDPHRETRAGRPDPGVGRAARRSTTSPF